MPEIGTQRAAKMSHCEDHGRHKAIFLVESDSLPETSTVSLPDDASDKPVGLVKEDGSINWSCPCLGGMAVGPCGVEFRAAFECFHYSVEEIKGSECLEKFMSMQECMTGFPDLYEERGKEGLDLGALDVGADKDSQSKDVAK